MNRHIALDGSWQFVSSVPGKLTAPYVSGPAGKLLKWAEAQVPGEVHLDLMRNGTLPDPYYRDNEEKSQWVHQRDWWFRRTFHVDADLLKEARVELVCDGLDTFAAVYLNGKEIGRADNMFRQFRFDIRDPLKAGENELVVLLRAPHVVLQELHEKHGFYPGGHNNVSQARKAQYSTGWDWGPDLTSIGIWRSVRLEAWSCARLVSTCARSLTLTDDEATVEVQVETLATGTTQSELVVVMKDPDGKAVARASVPAALKAGANLVATTLTVPHPRRWWPLGYGAQPLYRVEVAVTAPGLALADAQPFGFRTVEIRRQPDAEGESFIFVINGLEIFCKGVNWIPGDQFLPRCSTDYYRKNLDLAAKAGMNMVRVWGGGIYESRTFFEVCDELGIMVWQDFMFACASYPEYDAFRDNVIAEAGQAIRDLRNHPSLVGWCGNNECHWAKPHGWKGFLYYDEILPKLCAELDPTRPYWNGSPYAGPGENRSEELFGDCHSYKVWPGWATFYAYLTVRGKFLSEFGIQAPATRHTLAGYTQAKDRKPWSRVLEIHEKQSEKFVRNNRYICAHFPLSSKYDWWHFAGGATQCLGLHYAIAHWRSRKWLTAGTLIWQMNDCWPVVSWSLADYLGRPKAGWYEARRLFAPVFITIQIQLPPKTTDLWQLHQQEPWTQLARTVHLVNDTLAPVSGQVRLRLIDFKGNARWEKTVAAEVGANAAANVTTIPMAELGKFDPCRHVLVAELLDANGSVQARDIHWIGEPKHLELPAKPLTVERCGSTLTLRATGLTLYVEVEGHEAVPSDNFFHLLPGETRTIELAGPEGAYEVRTLNDLLRKA